jgi:hypothetical protein
MQDFAAATRWPGRAFWARACLTLLFVALAALVYLLRPTLPPRLVMFPWYAATVALATVWTGRLGGALTALAVASLGLCGDLQAVEGWAWVPLINILERLAIMLALVYLLEWRLRTHRAHARDDGLERDSPLTVCSCCSRVATSDRRWLDLDGFLRETGRPAPHLKLCSGCARERYLRG